MSFSSASNEAADVSISSIEEVEQKNESLDITQAVLDNERGDSSTIVQDSTNISKTIEYSKNSNFPGNFDTQPRSDSQPSTDITADIDTSTLSCSTDDIVILTSSDEEIMEPRMIHEDNISPKNSQNSSLERPKIKINKVISERKRKELDEHQKKKQELKEHKIRQKQERDKQKLNKKTQILEQKQKVLAEKLKEKELKDEKKRKDKEEKENKRKEKEQQEEQKRKEREWARNKRQQVLEERNKEKQKLKEQNKKTTAAFVNFFTKKSECLSDETTSEASQISRFMPFEVKADMKLAPILRRKLTEDETNYFNLVLINQVDVTYLQELKGGKHINKSGKTWPLEEFGAIDDDVIIVEETNFGERILEDQSKNNKIRTKLFKFAENRRPPYYGTWRRKSLHIKPRKPFARDTDVFNYEVDSDDDWEEEDPGESLHGSDDEKEVDSDNDYEVDNEFFVPHGHLSEDEINDEENTAFSPEAHKIKLKLLKSEFDEEMKCKTRKIKPRVVGCIWTNITNEINDTVSKFLQSLAIVANGPIVIQKRSDISMVQSLKKINYITSFKLLDDKVVPPFLQLIHGSCKNGKLLVNEFINYLSSENLLDISKANLSRNLRHFANWVKCPEEGIMHNKYCWYVREEFRKEYNVQLSLPNCWNSPTTSS